MNDKATKKDSFESTADLFLNCSRIGLFDSGVGGLSVWRRLYEFAANHNHKVEFIYLGDTLRCPYGNRTVAEITTFVQETVACLNDMHIDAIVIACNTSTANAYEAACSFSSVPVVELIQPTARLVTADGAAKIGVMSTVRTASSRAFSKAIHALSPGTSVFEIGCPDIVPIIETGRLDEPETNTVLKYYAEILRQEKIDTLILGCTHFPFIASRLQSFLPDHIKIVDPSEALVSGSGASDSSPPAVKLAANNAASGEQALCFDSIKTTAFVTGDAAKFELAARLCLGRLDFPISHINVAALPSLESRQQQSTERQLAPHMVLRTAQ